MQRASHGPGFDERAVLPQRALNGPPVEVFDPGPYGQLGRGHHLGVQAAETAGNREHAAGGRALIEVMAPDAPSRRPWPGKLHHSVTIMPPGTQSVASGVPADQRGSYFFCASFRFHGYVALPVTRRGNAHPVEGDARRTIFDLRRFISAECRLLTAT